jgi:ribosomal-protein-alanine N-acetyltransferase
LSYYIRPMNKQDLDDVTEIDREAFPTQWPPSDYGYEFKNQMAHYIVACDSGTPIEPRRLKTGPGKFRAWLDRLLGGSSPAPQTPPSPQHYIVGFAGFWVMAGEAHITSIAVREKYRRRAIGELLLAAVVDEAVKLGADVVTLEVRVSNTAAQNLYLKYGFKRVGERRKYYLDRGPAGETREDALIMTTDQIQSEGYQTLFRRLKEALVSS